MMWSGKMKCTVLFDCKWDENYPTNHTYGEFTIKARNDLDVIFYIKKKFLNHKSLLGYNFIICNGSNVWEIKTGV